MSTDHYRSAELIFGWSFYRQGSSGEASSADQFFDAALTWFGDPDPGLGTAWQKGERYGQTDRRSPNLISSGRPGAPTKPAWPTRGTSTGACPPGTSARVGCFQYRALRDYHSDADR